MSLDALSKYTIHAKYANFLPSEKRRENWSEMVDRVFFMHEEKYKSILDSNAEFKEEFYFAKNQVKKKRVLGSQRALQFGGKSILKKNQKIFNCSYGHISRIRAFQETMHLLLCGVGVGFSVQEQHIQKLPEIKRRDLGEAIFIAEDSIEGWSDCVGVIMSSYFRDGDFKEFYGKKVSFDLSLIRPEGSLIAGQFKAPGPNGLKNALLKVENLIEGRLNSGFKKLRPIDVYDVIMHCSDAVLSGGVRRAATICLFSLSDQEMLKAKTGNWFIENPQRGRSNNSVVLIKDSITKEQFSEIMRSTREYGEPGFVFLDNEDFGVNPCQPKWATVLTKDGIKTIGDISVGDEIWSKEGWTKVVKKWSNGEKEVWRFKTEKDGYEFIGTEDHFVISNGQRVKVKDAKSIDITKTLNIDTRITPSKIDNPIISKEMLGVEEVFDITVDNESHTYSTGGLDVSNCCEILMYPITEDGESGFQFCNLCEINGKACVDEETFYQSCRAAAIIGTLQAGYTDFPYLTDATKKITDREALLGVSITGMMDNPDVLLNAEVQRKGAQIVKEVNEKIAKMISINPAARTTCVKPAGSTSCLLSSSSGIHPHHARRYIRRVQANKNEFPLQYFEKINPNAVEESVWSANRTDKVISFLCEVPKNSITKNQITALDLLQIVKNTQENWVAYGVNEKYCAMKNMVHNVSNTITVKDDEWEEVEKFIFENRKNFTGISLLPASGDKDYPQAPFTTIHTPKELIEMYGDASVFASGLIVDGLRAFENNLWVACDCVLGIGQKIEEKLEEPDYPKNRSYKDLALYFEQKEKYEQWFLKKDWKRRCIQFANRYFNGNLKKATYCLKDVSNWKLWVDLKREYKDVDWNEAIEEGQQYENAANLAGQACSGGACEIKF